MKFYTGLLFLLTFEMFAQQALIRTDKGLIQGFQQQNLDVFLGIPFAKPPMGDLRWKAPVEMERWTGIKQCQAFGPSPFQNAPTPFAFWSEEYLIPKSPISEDCLYLNVWTKSKSSSKKAVLVYIYGGGFRSGGAACPIYDGANLAQDDIIVVSINYRVGPFGFLAHPSLSAESGYGSSGNYAILDMIAALQWVQKNISAFGGDPQRVTISGQSAGAFAVNFLCASPLAKGLFSGAIAESGSTILPNLFQENVTKAKAEEFGVLLADKLGAKSLVELRSKSAEEIQKASGAFSGPYQDGYVIDRSVLEIYQQHLQNDVPLLMGWNKDDRLAAKPMPVASFKEQIAKRFGNRAEQFFTVYPADTEAASNQSQIDFGRDESFAVKQFAWANLQTEKGKSPVFMYRFNRNLPAYTDETAFGAFHTAEVAYAFHNLDKVKRPFEAVDQELSRAMSTYWVNFIKTGNPNGKQVVPWPAYHQKGKMVQLLDTSIESKPLPDEQKLTFLLSTYRIKNSN